LIHKEKHLHLIEGDYKFDDFIQLHIINGHSPFQQIATVSDDNNTLLYSADLFPMASHIKVPYIMGYDLFPMTTLEEKKKFLQKIASEKWIVLFEHDPYTETAKVENTDKGFKTVDIMTLSQR
jgi:hypothetical protein